MPIRVDAVVLDVDGVLVDVSESYRRAIVDTIAHLFKTDIDRSAVQAFKDAGGFNNDWELTEAIAAYVLATRYGYPAAIESFAAAVGDHSGGLAGVWSELRAHFDPAIAYEIRRDVEMAPIRAVFQRLYLGPDRYEELEAEAPPAIDAGPGYIENEPVILESTTREWLTERFAIGVLTGRPAPEAAIALDRVGLALPREHRMTMDDWDGGKPNPDALITLATRLGAQSTAYVGDTGDDILTAQNADAADAGRSYVGLGVRTGETADTVFEGAGAVAIVDSVNELSSILEPNSGD